MRVVNLDYTCAARIFFSSFKNTTSTPCVAVPLIVDCVACVVDIHLAFRTITTKYLVIPASAIGERRERKTPGDRLRALHQDKL